MHRSMNAYLNGSRTWSMDLGVALTLITVLMLPGCGQRMEKDMNSLLLPYVEEGHVVPASSSGVRVYLRTTDGSPIDQDIGSQMGQRNRIYLLIRVGSVPRNYQVVDPDDRAFDDGSGYIRFFPKGMSADFGILRFSTANGRIVYAIQIIGDASPPPNYEAYVDIGGGLYAQYLYTADSHGDHGRRAEFVQRRIKEARRLAA